MRAAAGNCPGRPGPAHLAPSMAQSGAAAPGSDAVAREHKAVLRH